MTQLADGLTRFRFAYVPASLRTWGKYFKPSVDRIFFSFLSFFTSFEVAPVNLQLSTGTYELQ